MQYDKVPDLTVPLAQESKYSAYHEGGTGEGQQKCFKSWREGEIWYGGIP